MLQRKTLLVVVCLILLYASWGTAFLGNKMGLEYLPAFMLTGIRFTLAGAILFAFTLFKREKSTMTRSDIKYSVLNGFFLVFIASGFLVKGQESVASGVAAILFGAAPIWLMLGQWLLWGGKKPTLMQGLGLLLGFSALIALNLHHGIQGDTSTWGLVMILLASFAWVYGTRLSQVYQEKTKLSMFRGSSLTLIFGGLEALIISFVIGERVDFVNLPITAYFPVLYLTLVCSLVGYTTYLWLLFNTRAIVAISYEYVVPGVAIILGAIFANEPLGLVDILTSAVLIFSVFLITSHDRA